MSEFLQNLFAFLPQPWRSLAVPLITFLVVLLIGLAARTVIFSRLKKWTHNSKSNLDDVIIDSLHGPFLFWVAILGIQAATGVSTLSPGFVARAGQLLVALWIVAVTLALAKLAGKLVRLWGIRPDGSSRVGTLSEVLATGLVALLGGLMLLNAFGISITPILTALGVGGLAVALALQDTLSNFFAGFYLSLAGQVRVGDFVKVDSGEEGFVTDVGWRSTTLRERANNLIIIPNNKFAQAIVKNYHLPEKRTALLVRVGVSYASDPEHVERVLIDIASNIKTTGLLLEPPPFVRFIPGFGDFSLDFTLICQIADVGDQFQVQHDIRKEIIRRFKIEGIQIPFPTRSIEFINKPNQ